MDSTQYPPPSWIKFEILSLTAAIAAEKARKKIPVYKIPRTKNCVVCKEEKGINHFRPWIKTCMACEDLLGE
jgi:hypothetical protein